jgi:hypothetical protein
MAQTIRHQTFDGLASSTLDAMHEGGKMQELVMNEDALTMFLRKKKREMVEGGEQVRISIRTALANNIKSMSHWEDINMTPQDAFTVLFDDWAMYGGGVSVTGHEKRVNKGKAAVFSLLEERVALCVDTFAETVAQHKWYLGTLGSTDSDDVSANDGKDLRSIPIILPVYTGAASGMNADINYLGLDSTTLWKPKLMPCGGGLTIPASTFLQRLRTAWLDASKKAGGGPDLGICDYTTFGMIESAYDNKLHYTDTSMADMGFENIKLRGARVIPDVYVPDPYTGTQSAAAGGANALGALYFLNTKFWWWKVLSGADWKPGPWGKITGKDAWGAEYIFEGQLTCSNLQKNAVCHQIAPALAAGLTG